MSKNVINLSREALNIQKKIENYLNSLLKWKKIKSFVLSEIKKSDGSYGYFCVEIDLIHNSKFVFTISIPRKWELKHQWVKGKEKGMTFISISPFIFDGRDSRIVRDYVTRIINFIKYSTAVNKGKRKEDFVIYALGFSDEFAYIKKGNGVDDSLGVDIFVGYKKGNEIIRVPMQVKSSLEYLMDHKKKFPNIPGIYIPDGREDVFLVINKTLKICRKFVEGIIECV